MILCALGVLLVAVSRRKDAGSATTSETGRPLRAVALHLVSYLAVAVLLYWNAFSLGLLSDDFVILARASESAWWVRGGWDYFRPLTFALWRAIGAAPVPTDVTLHLVNIVLHAGNATLTAVLARRFGLGTRAAAAAGLLFLVFPASVEPVAWASGIQDVAMASTCLGFCVVATCRQQAPWHLAAAVVLLLAGLGFKETAIAMPLLAVAAAVAAGVRIPWRILGSCVLIVGGYLAWRLLAGDVPAEHMALPSRYVAKELLSRTFGTLALPFTKDETARFLPAAFLVASSHVIAFSVVAWRAAGAGARAARLAVLAAWALAAVVPVYSLFFVTDDLQGGRYLYLAVPAWAVLVAGVLDIDAPAARARRTAVLLVATLVAIWVAGAQWHLADWRRAAAMRDLVLNGIRQESRLSRCAVVTVLGVPDSVGGAYVFRNGLAEALHRKGILTPQQSLGAGSPDCTVDVTPAHSPGTP
jgi:hypothetical protein